MTISKSNQNDLSVVRAKLHAPRIPSDLVRRDRLHELLARNPGRPFTLVSAPAGYGKSTLVAHWLTTANLPGTWLSLEKSDNDIRQFLPYLITAVRELSKQWPPRYLPFAGRRTTPLLRQRKRKRRRPTPRKLAPPIPSLNRTPL